MEIQIIKGNFSMFGWLILRNPWFIVTNGQGASLLFQWQDVLSIESNVIVLG